MSPAEYREAIAALSLTQGEAAAFLGVSRRSSAGWAAGEYPVPLVVARLLALMLKLKLMPADL